jgi:hypothetical protein
MKKYMNPLLAVVLLLSTLSWQACKKHKDELGPVRAFTPSGDVKTTNGQTSVSITWKNAINADSATTKYTVIVSTDSTFANGPQFTFITDSAGIVLYDTQIAIKTVYYAQIKTNASDSSLDSHWLASGAFKILGEQIILPISDIDLKHNSVIVRWTHSDNVTKLVLTPTGGAATDIALTPTDVDSNFKFIQNLTPLTPYHISIYEGTKEVGYTDFTTKAVPIYAFVITPADNLETVLDTCSPNILIGLDPGEYESLNTLNNLVIKSKMVSLASTSNNPADTKVYFKEITLKGTGAGISLKGIDFDGSVAGALYFINLTGLAADGDAATFTKVFVENCTVHNYSNCFMRANRATATAGHVIDSIKVNNCLVKDNTFTNFYTEFQLTKLQFGSLTVTNTSFINAGQAMLEMTTTLPSGTPTPKVLFDHMTINNFGGNAKRLFDASANPVLLTITNNIIANAPRGTAAISADLIRATGAGTAVNFSYNNTFRLTVGAAGTPLSIPASTLALTTQTGNLTADLGWTATTASFIVPAGSPLLTSSNSGGLIGDPRWQ